MAVPPRNPLAALALVALLALSTFPLVAGEDLGPVMQDDAGSGRDAPDVPSDAVPVEPDTLYQGSSTGKLTDPFDHYVIHGEANQTFESWVEGSLGCYSLHDVDGQVVGDNACSYQGAPLNTGPIVTTLPYTGAYHLRVIHQTPADYAFIFTLNGTLPDIESLGIFKADDTPGVGPDPNGSEVLPFPDGCHDGFTMRGGGVTGSYPHFTDDCYHMRTGLNSLHTPKIDVLIVPPASIYPERDMRVMRQAIEMWAEGIDTLAPQMGMEWLSDGVEFRIAVDDDKFSSDPYFDPEIVVVATNPVGGLGIGIVPIGMPCHGQANPLATFDDWAQLAGFDTHHDKSGTYVEECEGGGSICYAVNGAIEPLPGWDFFQLYDLVAHEVGHCLTVGHVGDALDHTARNVPRGDIMAYSNRAWDKCVSTLDVEGFAITMSRFLLDTHLVANDADSVARGAFQVQHPDDHWYASPSGLPQDCPQPRDGLLP